MKRIIALILCMATALTFLVGCTKHEIGDYLKEYDYEPEVIEDVTLDLYIIGGESDEKARMTVSRMINQYTTEKFHTTLNLHYIDAASYNGTVSADIADSSKKVDIVLINNKAMYDGLRATDSLHDLTAYFESDKFGMLNSVVAETLLKAASEKAVESSGDAVTGVADTGDRIFCVPNNRVIGEYTYLLVNKEQAMNFSYGYDLLNAMENYEDTAELRAAIDGAGRDSSAYVKEVKGSYADKALFESQGYFAKVTKYPTVTKEMVFESAFAVMKNCEKTDRAMEILYTINTDTYFRNRLQYGVKNTNYTLNETTGEVIPATDKGNVYSMDLLYTGTIFKAYYSSNPAHGWNAEIAKYASKQNAESVVE